MTLKPCPECGTQISATAIACPQCGHQIQVYAWPFGYQDEQTRAANQRVIFVVGLVLMFVMLGLMYFVVVSQPARTLPSPAPAAPVAPPAA